MPMRTVYRNPADAGTLAGATQEGSGPYGTVPKVPSPTATQGAAIGGNVAALPQIEQIMQRINKQAAQSAMEPYLLNMPGYTGAMGKAMSNIGQLQAGVVPSDVLAQISQAAAERGIGLGLAGSENANAAMLRALGLTSLGLQQQGLQGLTSLMGAVPRAPLYDPSSLFVTPAQQQEWQYMANMMAAAPSPAQAAAAEMAAAQSGVGYGGRIGGGYGGGGYTITGGAGGAPLPHTPGTNWGPAIVSRGTGESPNYPGWVWDQSRGDYVREPQPAYGAQGYFYPGTVMQGNITGQAMSPYEELYGFTPEEAALVGYGE